MAETHGGSASDQESESEKLTRNLNELLQELRVTQMQVSRLLSRILKDLRAELT